LFVDARGLGYEYDSPETTYANDLLELMRRGDVTQSSFGFTVKKDTWIQRGNVMFRFIEKVGRLYDVSPVTYPAYPATTVGIANRNSIPNDDLQREPIEQSADGNTETPIQAFRIRLIKTQN
jgi:HK97 family phage prohead protease